MNPGFGGLDLGPNPTELSGLASGQRCPAQPQPAPCGAKTGATVY